MAISNVANTNTIEEFRVITNQVIVGLNSILEGNAILYGTLTLNPANTKAISLNVANGFIKGNGFGLTALQNTSISGVLLNSQIQNSGISISTSNGITSTHSGANLGNSLILTLKSVDSVSNTRNNLPLAANVGNSLHDFIISVFDSSNNVTSVGAAGFNKANAANVLAFNANSNAFTSLALGATAFNKANAANVLAFNANSLATVATVTANYANALLLTTNSVAYGAFAQANSIVAATAAQMEAATSNSVFVAPGNFRISPFSPKTFGSFLSRGSDGSCTVVANSGITSVTRNGIGQYDVVWDVSFSSANYLIFTQIQDTSYSGMTPTIVAKSSTGCTISFNNTINGLPADAFDECMIMSMGDQ